jgi:hypothetical protein
VVSDYAMSRTLIDGPALPWTLTVLFGASFAVHVYVLVAQHGPWTRTVERLLHSVMCAAMVVMAWPVGMGLPPLGPIIFFLAAAVWFLLVAAHVFSGTAGRLTNAYHAIMMAAVAWLYAAMAGVLPGQGGQPHNHTMSSSPGMQMPGMDVSVAETTQAGWITTLNWIAVVGYAAAAAYWLFRYFAPRKTNSGPRTASLAALGPPCHAFMASGMAIMFGAML